MLLLDILGAFDAGLVAAGILCLLRLENYLLLIVQSVRTLLVLDPIVVECSGNVGAVAVDGVSDATLSICSPHLVHAEGVAPLRHQVGA